MENSIFLIIIQKKPYTYTCLSSEFGTMSVYLPQRAKRPPLVRGALVSVTVTKRQQGYELSNVDCLALPASWVADSLHFLHHIIELVAFFVPENQASGDIFNHMLSLYREQPAERNAELVRNLFLCKFFMMTGLYPEPTCAQDVQFLRLLEQGFDEYAVIENDVFLQKKMIEWLDACVALHPASNQIKTRYAIRA